MLLADLLFIVFTDLAALWLKRGRGDPLLGAAPQPSRPRCMRIVTIAYLQLQILGMVLEWFQLLASVKCPGLSFQCYQTVNYLMMNSSAGLCGVQFLGYQLVVYWLFDDRRECVFEDEWDESQYRMEGGSMCDWVTNKYCLLRVGSCLYVVSALPAFVSHILPMVFAYCWMVAFYGLCVLAIYQLLLRVLRDWLRLEARIVRLICFKYTTVLCLTLLTQVVFNYGFLLYSKALENRYSAGTAVSASEYAAVVPNVYSLRSTGYYFSCLQSKFEAADPFGHFLDLVNLI
jgi:hypothetical protein